MEKQQTLHPNTYYRPRPMEIDMAQCQERRKLTRKAKPEIKYSKSNSKCYNCGKKGHFKSECRSPHREYEKKKGNNMPTAKQMVQIADKGKKPVSPEAEKRSQLGLSIQTKFGDESPKIPERESQRQVLIDKVVAKEKVAQKKYLE